MLFLSSNLLCYAKATFIFDVGVSNTQTNLCYWQENKSVKRIESYEGAFQY